MTLLHNDDQIFRGYRPKWIEASGTELPYALRYDTWQTFIATFVIAVLAVNPVPGMTRLQSYLAAACIALLATTVIIHEVSGDRSLRGVVELARNETHGWRRTRKTEPARGRLKIVNLTGET